MSGLPSGQLRAEAEMLRCLITVHEDTPWDNLEMQGPLWGITAWAQMQGVLIQMLDKVSPAVFLAS